MSEFIQKNKLFILVILGALMIILIFNFVLRPEISNYFKDINKLNQSQNELSSLNGKITGMNKNRSKILKLQKQLNQVNNLIPQTINEADLIVQITEAAQALGVSISTLSFSDSAASVTNRRAGQKQTNIADSKLFNKIDISISATGSYQSIESLLKRLTNLDRIVIINSVNFTPSETSNGASITLSTYYSK